MIKRFLSRNSPLVILTGLCLILAVVSSDFRNPENLQRVALRTTVICIMGMGQILVILTAGIDLSVGSVAALAGVVCGLVMTDGAEAMNLGALTVPFGVAAGCATGALCGLVNGVLVTKGRIPPFIVTLGMMMAARGTALLISGAVPIFGAPESFRFLGGASGWGIPVAIMMAVVSIVSVTLAFTRYGRSVYATGGNLTGARLSGIPVDRVRTVAYTLCGLLAGLAGVILASRTIPTPTAAEGYELDVIAACVIGGASLMGGEGTGAGVLAGALIMNVLVNFCNLNDINVHWQRILVGSLIVGLVYYDTTRKRRAGLLGD